MAKLPKSALEFFRKWGAKGGRVKSADKKRSGKINAAKATAARMAKRKASP